MDFKHTDFDNFKEVLDISKMMKRKRYISPKEIKMYCPNAQIIPEWVPGVATYEIMSESIEQFFREHQVTHVVVNRELYHRTAPIQIESQTTVVIKCKIETCVNGKGSS